MTSNGIDLSQRTITITLTNRSSDDACPLVGVTTTQAGDGAVGFEPSIPLFESGYSKQEDAIGEGEVGNFRLDVSPATSSQREVDLVEATQATARQRWRVRLPVRELRERCWLERRPSNAHGHLQGRAHWRDALSATLSGTATCAPLTNLADAVTIE